MPVIEIRDYTGRQPGIVDETLSGHQNIAQRYREEAAELEARAAAHEAEAPEEEAKEGEVIDAAVIDITPVLERETLPQTLFVRWPTPGP